MWRNRFTPTRDDVKFVVSDNGEVLSPNQEPQIAAPAVIPAGIPRPEPIPRRATPMVPSVPQEVPVAMETMEQRIKAAGRKNFALMISIP